MIKNAGATPPSLGERWLLTAAAGAAGLHCRDPVLCFEGVEGVASFRPACAVPPRERAPLLLRVLLACVAPGVFPRAGASLSLPAAVAPAGARHVFASWLHRHRRGCLSSGGRRGRRCPRRGDHYREAQRGGLLQRVSGTESVELLD